MGRTLYRSRNDRMLAGVAGGLAEYLGQDPTLIRIGVVLLTLVTSGSVVLAYLVLWIVVPEAPAEPGDAPGETLVDQWFGSKDTAAAAAQGPATAATDPVSEPEPAAEPAVTQPMAAEPMVGVGPPASALTGDPPPAPPAPAPAPPTSTSTRGGWWFGVGLVAIGGFMLAERFLPRFAVWDLWPVLIIIVGLAMVFSRKDG